MSHPLTLIATVEGQPAIFDFSLEAGILPKGIRCRYFDLPPAARQLSFGTNQSSLENKLILFQDLLQYAIPLWKFGLSTPDYYPGDKPRTPEELINLALPEQHTEWVGTLVRTFPDHTVHWYHVAHVLTQILNELGAKAINWSQIAYLLQAGGPFFSEIISRLLLEYTDDALKARLLNALLFFPTDLSRKRAMSFLKTLNPTDSVGTFSLVNTLQHFPNPEAQDFRERFGSFSYQFYPISVKNSSEDAQQWGQLNAAWQALSEQEYTNQSTVKFLLEHPDVPIDKLVEACHHRPDWLELLGRFWQKFIEKGYRGDLVPVLDEFVVSNVNRYKWPTGERHHKRIEPEISHALHQQSLRESTFQVLNERLYDKDEFRRNNAAMHLAAYCQLPRILNRRETDGSLSYYFVSPPAERTSLPAKTVARLIELTLNDPRITIYNHAARAVAQLTLDEVHGEGITDYLIERAEEQRSSQDFIFCCYLLLPTFHLNPRKNHIKPLLVHAIDLLDAKAYAGFGRLLLKLHLPELSRRFLKKIAPSQVNRTYAIFEELAQSVNLLHDTFHELPLAVFHPEFGVLGEDAGAKE